MSHHILLIGGHGKVAQLLTPLLLSRSWNVTSMIRTADQKPAIEALGKNQPGKLDVLVSSVADVKSESDTQQIIERVKPDVIATGNIGCLTQIGTGTNIPIVHTVELLDWATGGPMPAALKSIPAAAAGPRMVAAE